MISSLPSAIFSQNPDTSLDAALREPVIITKRGQPHMVLIAYEEYLRLIRRGRRVDLTAVLCDEDLAANVDAEMDGTFTHLVSKPLTENYPADRS